MLPHLLLSPVFPRSDLEVKHRHRHTVRFGVKLQKNQIHTTLLMIIREKEKGSDWRTFPSVLTIKWVQCFAVTDDRERVIVVKFIVKFVRVWVLRSCLWWAGALARSVMLLAGVICVTAFRADGKKAVGGFFFFFFRFIVDLFDLALFSLQQDLLYSYLSLPCGVWWWLSALCLLSPLELCFPSTSDNQVCQHRWISGDFCYYYTKYIFIKIPKNKNVVLQEKDKV